MDNLSTIFDEKPHVLELYRKMENRMEKDRRTVISWREPKEKGVVVKTGGVYAYVPFSLMPWTYKIAQWWNHVLPHMMYIKWFGRVIDVDYTVPMIKIDARQSFDDPPQPEEGKAYKGVVVRKDRHGVTLDMGLHFQWKSGPLLQAVNGLDMNQYLSDIAPGDVIYPRFLGLDSHQNWILSMRHLTREERMEERREIFENEVDVSVKVDESGRRRCLVKDQIPVSMIAEKAIYKEFKGKVRRAIKRLKDGDVIKCRVYPTSQNSGKLRAVWLEWVPVKKSETDPAAEMAFTIGERIENQDDLIRLNALKDF
jgi:ribosomal protein S1